MKATKKKQLTDLQITILANVRKIMEINKLTQKDVWTAIDIDSATMSRIYSGSQGIDFCQLESLSTFFKMTPIDLITYPDHYVKDCGEHVPAVSLTIEVTPENYNDLIKFIKK